MSGGCSLAVVRQLLIWGLLWCGTWASAVVACLGSCGSQPWLPRGTWDLPGPGIEPVSSALAGGFLTLDHQGGPQTPSALEQAAAGLLFSHPVVSSMPLASVTFAVGYFFPSANTGPSPEDVRAGCIGPVGVRDLADSSCARETRALERLGREVGPAGSARARATAPRLSSRWCPLPRELGLQRAVPGAGGP